MNAPSRPRRDPRMRERAVFFSLSLFVVALAVAGHQYFGSAAGRARRIVGEARAKPAARALKSLGCIDPKALAPAEAAQLAHLGYLSGIAVGAGTALVLCDPGGGTVSCERVADAYERAGGDLPAQVVVFAPGGVTCSVVRIPAAAHRVLAP